MIYLQLFLEFFKIGLFTFGGGFAMIPLVEETVLKHTWLTETQFYNFIGVCESTPGPIAINMATYVGSVQGGVLGSILATLGVVLPSFLIILLVASVMRSLTETREFRGFIRGVQPVIAALILSTGLLLLAKAIGFSGLSAFAVNWVSIVIFALLLGIYFLLLKVWKKPSAIQLILLSAVLGIVVSLLFEVCGYGR
ncbi:MAG: chromate transporter [Ruminococcaceae bacterium]|nr:chromate transporter [Oscillospiraceae bacterium]